VPESQTRATKHRNRPESRLRWDILKSAGLSNTPVMMHYEPVLACARNVVGSTYMSNFRSCKARKRQVSSFIHYAWGSGRNRTAT
jgi:hypothetical protein